MAGMYLGGDATLLQTLYEPLVCTPTTSLRMISLTLFFAGCLCHNLSIFFSIHDPVMVDTIRSHHWKHGSPEAIRKDPNDLLSVSKGLYQDGISTRGF